MPETPFLEHALSSNRVCGRHFNGYEPAMYESLRYVSLIYLEHVFDLIWEMLKIISYNAVLKKL